MNYKRFLSVAILLLLVIIFSSILAKSMIYLSLLIVDQYNGQFNLTSFNVISLLFLILILMSFVFLNKSGCEEIIEIPNSSCMTSIEQLREDIQKYIIEPAEKKHNKLNYLIMFIIGVFISVTHLFQIINETVIIILLSVLFSIFITKLTDFDLITPNKKTIQQINEVFIRSILGKIMTSTELRNEIISILNERTTLQRYRIQHRKRMRVFLDLDDKTVGEKEIWIKNQ